MASIRARLTTTYAAALAGTMLVFGVTTWIGRGASEERAIQRYVLSNANVALRLIQQEAERADTAARVQLVEPASNPLLGPQLVRRLRALLNVVPEILIVTDSTGNIVYQSFETSLLNTGYASAIAAYGDSLDAPRLYARKYIERDTASIYAKWIGQLHLDTSEVVLMARVKAPPRLGPLKYIIAAGSLKPMVRAQNELLGSMLAVAPFVLIISIAVAYYMAGDTLRPLDHVRSELEAITDGRSLHRRLPVEATGDELARLAATLNAMIGRLETSFGALRRFTADASHELKTPLTVLRANVERSMNTPQGSSDQLVALEEALAEIARMADLVDSLLTLARFDEGRFDLHREPVELEPIVRDVLETAVILGEAAGLTIALAVCEPATVLGDAARLRQLFLNLVTNAIKYTSAGGTVELSLRTSDGTATFAVRDTGIGIAAADLPYIFDRFWRADRARSRRAFGESGAAERGGFGLGLAISQWIAQAHGGTLSVASRLTRGSTFTVSMPVIGEPEVSTVNTGTSAELATPPEIAAGPTG